MIENAENGQLLTATALYKLGEFQILAHKAAATTLNRVVADHTRGLLSKYFGDWQRARVTEVCTAAAQHTC